ncbi:peroxide stress protein YaaA [Helcococcus kunzii]|uniref:UPF0246 protein HMPREF9709_00393 n=1 Tax=Helcococcus kunzii ATCC 51366 TaxID=883114 RepID=H3NM32_9FIRM|nr:peroxide stress protein YaaA [Helcococcus kunzii]EHR35702.1 hypothetical protein HMPREF9709_00393 [Helcococcus kunzii ATCC 51366]QUY64347.1 peroxide stress protein YaaA [Helcococcus kunzii]
MKILFSPSKEMKFDKVVEIDWILTDEIHKIKTEIEKLSDKELIKSLKINENILQNVKQYIENLNVAKTYPAIHMYNGLSFRTMNPSSFDSNEMKYINKNLLILSAFYGPIMANTLIKPYRLDFNSSLKIDGKNLKNFWKEKYNSTINEKELVLNLASNEFSDLFDKEKYEWIDFDFYSFKDGQYKSHSTTSKKGRGWLVSYLAKNQITSIEDIRNVKDSYIYVEKLSTKNKLAFVMD